jgi:N-acyl-D-aspartate/D-glutamate deacylase
MTWDLLIRDATVIDGTGAPAVREDLAVRDGRIVARGQLPAQATEIVDAAGLALMPGIVDLHTHYDAQITWDPTCSPSPGLGVTTAVIGNCGFGIAPCPAPHRQTMTRNLSVVEGMDLAALQQGIRWDFESFAQYLERIRQTRPYLNIAVFAGHSTIRTAVMGEEASTLEQPTEAQLDAMVALLEQAMDAGAIGFASSFSPNHSGYGGLPMPSTIAPDHELERLVDVLGRRGRGVFMSATGPRATPAYMERLAERTGRPMFISTVLSMYSDAAPERGWAMYEQCAQAQDRGREVYIQTSCQPLSFEFDLLSPYVLYSHPAFEAVKAANGDPDILVGLYRDSQMRERFRADLRAPREGILFQGDWRQIELKPARAHNAMLAERSLHDLALESGRDPVDLMFDFALSEDLQTRFIGKFFQNRDEPVAKLLTHRAGVIALSDAGAHLTYLCDAGFGIHLLSHWVRETGTFTLQEAVRRLTSQPADLYRIADRGRLREGAWADMVLFDPDTIALSRMRAVDDLPGGGRRMVRDAQGLHGVWVNGQRTWDTQGLVSRASGPGQLIDRFAA